MPTMDEIVADARRRERISAVRPVVGEGVRLLSLSLLFGVPGIYLAGVALQGF
jgi:hypothetical protein